MTFLSTEAWIGIPSSSSSSWRSASSDEIESDTVISFAGHQIDAPLALQLDDDDDDGSPSVRPYLDMCVSRPGHFNTRGDRNHCRGRVGREYLNNIWDQQHFTLPLYPSPCTMKHRIAQPLQLATRPSLQIAMLNWPFWWPVRLRTEMERAGEIDIQLLTVTIIIWNMQMDSDPSATGLHCTGLTVTANQSSSPPSGCVSILIPNSIHTSCHDSSIPYRPLISWSMQFRLK